jgi:hypothetical protein
LRPPAAEINTCAKAGCCHTATLLRLDNPPSE